MLGEYFMTRENIYKTVFIIIPSKIENIVGMYTKIK